MERLLFVMKLHPDKVDEYERRHEAVWPALLADLHRAGWRNYSLFRRDLQVYGYAECHPSIAAAQAAMADSEANAEWAAWFTDVIEEITDADGNLIQAEQCWHMDEELAAASDPSDPNRPKS